MSIKDAIKKSVLQEFTDPAVTMGDIAAALGMAAVLALYIYLIYKLVTRSAFYSRDFNKSLAMLPVITAGILLAMQSSFVISLGSVGALSIVRFRNAVKDPMDLVFLFWSISIGIICGAGLYEVALVTSVAVTVCILALDLLPVAKVPMMLVVNSSVMDGEAAILDVVGKYAKSYKVKSRNLSKGRLDMVVELRVKDESGLVTEVAAMDGMISASLIAHDGEVTF